MTLLHSIQLANCVEIGLPMLILLVIVQQVIYLSQTPTLMLKFFSASLINCMFFVAAFEAVFEAHPWFSPRHTWEVWFASLHWYCLGFCCYPHCGWCLQQRRTAEKTELPCRSDLPYIICSMVSPYKWVLCLHMDHYCLLEK